MSAEGKDFKQGPKNVVGEDLVEGRDWWVRA